MNGKDSETAAMVMDHNHGMCLYVAPVLLHAITIYADGIHREGTLHGDRNASKTHPPYGIFPSGRVEQLRPCLDVRDMFEIVWSSKSAADPRYS